MHNSPTHSHSTAGFTLIELLVVAALSVIIIIGASSLFFTSLISSSRKEILTTVKQEGDYASSQIEFLLRNALQLEKDTAMGVTCTTGMKSITFRSRDEGITTLSVVSGKIASSSGTNVAYLTTDAVTLADDQLFDCQQSGGVGGYIKIHFTLTKQNTDFNAPNNASDRFETSVSIRSY